MESLCVSCPQWRCSLGSTRGHHGLSNKDVSIPAECSNHLSSSVWLYESQPQQSSQHSTAEHQILLLFLHLLNPKDHPEELLQDGLLDPANWPASPAGTAEKNSLVPALKIPSPDGNSRGWGNMSLLVLITEPAIHRYTMSEAIDTISSSTHFHTIGLGPFNPCTLKTAAASHGQPSHSRAETCSSCHRGNITWASPNKKHH